MKTAISIPDALFDAAEQFAQRIGISRSELYQKALANYLSARRDESITETLNEVYADSDTVGLDRSLATMQLDSIPDEDWE